MAGTLEGKTAIVAGAGNGIGRAICVEFARAGARVVCTEALLGPLGQPEEIARAALFLASDAASFVTGSDLLVAGRYTTI